MSRPKNKGPRILQSRFPGYTPLVLPREQEEIESLIQRGYFKRFVRKDGGRIEESCHVPQKITSTAVAIRAKGQGITGGTPIRTIFGGPADEEAREIHQPHDDALVIFIILANMKVYRVLIDNGRSVNILYAAAFNKIENGSEKLKPVRTPLIDFERECLIPLGSIELLVTIGEPPHQATKMINFLVVEHPSVYNVILGRPSLNMFQVVTSTYHLMMKFPTEGGVGVLRADQEESRRCYATVLRGKITLDPREEKGEQRGSPVEELDIVQLQQGDESKCT
ncbi:hypothetical protein WN943_010419 [Citrus x changshan-huyou]